MHAKHTIWGKETFPETCPFTVYEHVRCQEAKNQGKHPIRLQKITKTFNFSAYDLLTYKNT